MNQLFEDGKVVTVDGTELECVSIGYQETDGKRHHFTYGFRLKSEIDSEREAIAQAEAARQAADEASQLPAPEPEEPTKPEEFKEETLNVK